MGNEGTQIIDIRDRSQWLRDGVEGSVCIPMRSLNVDHLKGFKRVVFVCYSGQHSRRLAHKYSDVLDCEGKRLKDIKKG